MIHPSRIRILNKASEQAGTCIVYWMQQSQRVEYNHALTYAIELANERNMPLLVFFALTESFPESNLRHYHFMLGGLAETSRSLEKHGIRMVVCKIDPSIGIVNFAKTAAIVVTDCGYLRLQKEWRQRSAQLLPCSLIQVESDVIVPVTEASDKEEYSAATIRSKLHRRLKEFFTDFRTPDIKKDSLSFKNSGIDLGDTARLSENLNVDRSVAPVNWILPGETAAAKMLDTFIATRLDHFKDLRNDPSLDYSSNMSPYLHFGQISPFKIAHRVVESGSYSADAFLEEVFVRRELAMNFVMYNSAYDSYESLPLWCKKSLDKHHIDKREYLYSAKQFELAETHDPYWNAAQTEMVKKGKMHGYMRMYWGKKILEWTDSPQKAYKIALALNNKYSLDGRDPNSFTGIAWCFGKHDRAWNEHPVFGKVRYMNANGLKRKFNIKQYVLNVKKLAGS